MTKYTIPIQPVPQSRPRFNGRQKRAYEKPEMTAYKKSVRYHVMADRPKIIEKGAVSLDVCFYVQPPQYIAKVKKNTVALQQETMFCEKKPDIDNYFKAVTDAVNGVLYKDDGQIAVMICRKVYSLNPRTEISIDPL